MTQASSPAPDPADRDAALAAREAALASLASEASDPATAPGRLDELTRGTPDEIRRLVAGNPAASFDTLWPLAMHFPAEVLANPSFFLYLLEDPTLARLMTPVRASLARCGALAPSLQAAFLQDPHPDVRRALASNPGLPPDAFDTLIAHHDEYVRLGLALNPSLPLKHRKKLCGDHEGSVRRAAASGGQPISGWVALLARADFNANNRKHPRRKTPLSWTDELALLDSGVWARELLARQPRLGPAIAQKLAADPSPEVRLALARRADLLDDVALALLDPDQPAICKAIAARKALPEILIVALARLPAPEAHALLLRRLSLPAEAQRALASRPWAAPALLLRPDLCPDLFETMASGPQATVVASHPAAPDALLRRLASDPRWELRHAVASNPTCPNDTRDALALDPDERVRGAAGAWRQRATGVVDRAR